MSQQTIPLDELAERYKKIYTPAIADILDEQGLMHQILPPSIQALAPGMRDRRPGPDRQGDANHHPQGRVPPADAPGLHDSGAGRHRRVRLRAPTRWPPTGASW